MKKIVDKRFTFTELVSSIQSVHNELLGQAKRAVNISLTLRNWLIGCYIAEYEMRGADRAKYGDRLMGTLAETLTKQGVSRCDRRELYRYRQFYLMYPQIVEALTPQFMPFLNKPIRQTPVSLSGAALEGSNVKNVMTDTDNPPIGILLCTRKDHALVEYALAGLDNQLFVSKYQLELPKQEDMQRFIEEQIKESRL